MESPLEAAPTGPNPGTTTDSADTCPYAHIRDHPTTTTTTPTLFDNAPDDTSSTHQSSAAALHTLFHGRQQTPRTKLVNAIADSGASHVLLRASDAHVLGDVVYT